MSSFIPVLCTVFFFCLDILGYSSASNRCCVGESVIPSIWDSWQIGFLMFVFDSDDEAALGCCPLPAQLFVSR